MPAISLADRLKWILSHRAFPDAKALSVAAGLAPSHVGQMIRGDVKGRPAGETLAKIASAADVNLTWLTTGAGSPEPAESETRVVREDADVSPGDDGALSALDAAIRAADAGRNERWVFDLARRASATIHMQVLEGQSLESVARDLLTAAKRLGKDAKPGVVAQQALVGLRQPPHDRRV